MRQPVNIPTDIQLWDSAYIADLLRLKVKYFQEHVASAPGFPQALRFPLVGGGRTTPRWKAEEVMEWISQHQERRAA